MGSRPPQAEAAPCPPSARAPLSAWSFLTSGGQIEPSLEVEKVVPQDPPPSLCPLERVTAQRSGCRAPRGVVQEPAGRTHLDGSLPNDLAQLGNVVILLDGCPQVPVIVRLDCCGFTPKSSLGREPELEQR